MLSGRHYWIGAVNVQNKWYWIDGTRWSFGEVIDYSGKHNYSVVLDRDEKRWYQLANSAYRFPVLCKYIGSFSTTV